MEENLRGATLHFAPFSRPFPKIDSFTLRACPPTHLHAAQFLRSAAYSQRNFIAAQFLLFLANRGGPQGGDPWDPKERAPTPPPPGTPPTPPTFTQRRGPFGAPGRMGAVGMISTLFRIECFSDGASPIASHALQRWGKKGPTS